MKRAKSRWAIGRVYIHIKSNGQRVHRKITKKNQAEAKAEILAREKRLAAEHREKVRIAREEANYNIKIRRMESRAVNEQINRAKRRGVKITYAEGLRRLDEQRAQRITNLKTSRVKAFVDKYNEILHEIKAIVNDPNLPDDVRQAILDIFPWHFSLDTDITIDDVYEYGYDEMLNNSRQLIDSIRDMLEKIQDILIDAKNLRTAHAYSNNIVNVESLIYTTDQLLYYADQKAYIESVKGVRQVTDVPNSPDTDEILKEALRKIRMGK